MEILGLTSHILIEANHPSVTSYIDGTRSLAGRPIKLLLELF